MIVARTGGGMASTPQTPKTPATRDRKLSGIGATEEQIDMRDTVPQRIDREGTKVEDLAGTGTHDAAGG
jgi:hypothetical protein